MTTRFTWTLAWSDNVLSAACTDLRAGIVGAARTVFAETREQLDFTRQAYASALLGSVAADSNVAELWVTDERRNPDAYLLLARVWAHRAHQMIQPGKPYDGALLRAVRWAEQAGSQATKLWDADPTPWLVHLSLESLRLRRAVLPAVHTELGALHGPWDLVERQIWPRDPFSRESGHRLLDYFSPRGGGSNAEMDQLCRWATLYTPRDSPLQLLPLAAELKRVSAVDAIVHDDIARYRRIDTLRRCLAETDVALKHARVSVPAVGEARPDPHDLLAQWQRLDRELTAVTAPDVEMKAAGEMRDHLRKLALGIYGRWFLAASLDNPIRLPRSLPLSDLMLLAYTLHQVGEMLAAGNVLAFTRPYATPSPWSRDGDPDQVLARAYADCRLVVPP